jgi:hypothetical protein
VGGGAAKTAVIGRGNGDHVPHSSAVERES